VFKPPTALVVDDSPELRMLFSSLFRDLGMNVLTARDGETALALARDERPDIICLDLMLPTIGGLEICHTLKSAPETSDIPVMVVSARRMPQDRAEALKVGADAYLTKPVDRNDFTTKARTLLWQRQMATVEA